MMMMMMMMRREVLELSIYIYAYACGGERIAYCIRVVSQARIEFWKRRGMEG